MLEEKDGMPLQADAAPPSKIRSDPDALNELIEIIKDVHGKTPNTILNIADFVELAPYNSPVSEPLSSEEILSSIEFLFVNSEREIEDFVSGLMEEEKKPFKVLKSKIDEYIKIVERQSGSISFRAYLTNLSVDFYTWIAQLQYLFKDENFEFPQKLKLNFTHPNPDEVLTNIFFDQIDFVPGLPGVDKYKFPFEAKNPSIILGCPHFCLVKTLVDYAISYYSELRRKIVSEVITILNDFINSIAGKTTIDNDVLKIFLAKISRTVNLYDLLFLKNDELHNLCNKVLHWPFPDLTTKVSKEFSREKKKISDLLDASDNIDLFNEGIAELYPVFAPVFKALNSVTEQTNELPEDVSLIIKAAVADVLETDAKTVRKAKRLPHSVDLYVRNLLHVLDLIKKDNLDVKNNVFSYAAFVRNLKSLLLSETFRNLFSGDEKERKIENHDPSVLVVAHNIQEKTPEKLQDEQTYEKYIYSERFLNDLSALLASGALAKYQDSFIIGDDKAKAFLLHPYNVERLVKFGESAFDMLSFLSVNGFGKEIKMIKNGRFDDSPLIRNLLKTPSLFKCIWRIMPNLIGIFLPTVENPFFMDTHRALKFVEFAEKFQTNPAYVFHGLEAIRTINDYDGLMFLNNANLQEMPYFIVVREMIQIYGFSSLKRLHFCFTKEVHEILCRNGYKEGEDLTASEKPFMRISGLKRILDECLNPDIKKNASIVNQYSRKLENSKFFEALQDLNSKLNSLDFLNDFDFLDDIDYMEFTIRLAKLNKNVLEKLIKDKLLVRIAQNVAQNSEFSFNFLDNLSGTEKVGEVLKKISEWHNTFKTSEEEDFLKQHSKGINAFFGDNAELIILKIKEGLLSSTQLGTIKRLVDLFEVSANPPDVSNDFIGKLAERIFDGQFRIIEIFIEFFVSGYNTTAIESFFEIFDTDESIDEFPDALKDFVDEQDALIQYQLQTELAEEKKSRNENEGKSNDEGYSDEKHGTLENKRILILVGDCVTTFDIYRKAAKHNGAQDPSVVSIKKFSHRPQSDIKTYLAGYDVVVFMVSFMSHKDTIKVRNCVPDTVYWEFSSLGASGLKTQLANLQI
jgi:hypothetical protein